MPSLRRICVSSVTLLVAAACASEPPEPKIPVNPTAQGALPAAITGTAPAPRGMALNYVDGDSATTGYLAVPEGDGPFPALLIVHEWNGLVDRIRQMADGFAEEGYVTLAVDLYSGRTGSSPDENMALVQETQSNQQAVIDNMNAAASYLRSRSDVSGKIATMGWCFGGGIALSYAIGGEHHEGTAIFYGSLVEDPALLRSITHEVYGTFAEMDNGIPPDQVARFAAALDSLGIGNDIHVYDAVNHGFWLRVDGDEELRAAPALDAWQRLKAYLGRVLSD